VKIEAMMPLTKRNEVARIEEMLVVRASQQRMRWSVVEYKTCACMEKAQVG
jgi:hypothetical protein